VEHSSGLSTTLHARMTVLTALELPRRGRISAAWLGHLAGAPTEMAERYLAGRGDLQVVWLQTAPCGHVLTLPREPPASYRCGGCGRRHATVWSQLRLEARQSR